MKKISPQLVWGGAVILSVIIVFANLFFALQVAKTKLPNVSYYGFPIRFLGDTLTNVFRIKLGQEGTIWYENAYSDEFTPPVLFEPVYNLVGMVTKPLGLTPLESYELFHFITLALFIIAIGGLITPMFTRIPGRILAMVLFLTSTSIWSVKEGVGLTGIVNPPSYSDYFDVFTKINDMKAHHLLAQVTMIGIFLLLARNNLTKKHLIVLFLLAFSLGFLNPYLSIYAGIFIGFECCIRLAIKKGQSWPSLIPGILVLATLIPLVVYHGYILNTYWKVDIDMGGTTVWAPRGYSLMTYVLSLGPVFFVSLPAIVLKQVRTHRLGRLLLIWGFLPMVLFYLPDLHIPMSAYRLFQSYQQIPLSILAAVVLVWGFSKLRIPVIVGGIVIGLLATAYAYPPYKEQFLVHTDPWNNFFLTQNLMQQSLPILAALEKQSPKNSIVIASEAVSMFIPIFTHGKALMAHPGTNPNFPEKSRVGYTILMGQMPVGDVGPALKKYRISYILFGTETPGSPVVPFTATPYTTLPFLKVIYTEGYKSIVEVDQNALK